MMWQRIGLVVSLAHLLPRGAAQVGMLGGDACLPRDIVTLLRSDLVRELAVTCAKDDETYGSAECSSSCHDLVLKFKEQRCYAYLTQSQRSQGRMSRPSLPAMQGTWYGLYPASGIELMELSYDATTSTLSGTKLTGNQYVRAGRVSWEATPSGCRVVSSQWANVYTPRWDPCTLTMWEDHLRLSLGSGPDEDLAFVRASAPLLFEWQEQRAPTYGFASVFERCEVPIEDGMSAFLASLWHQLHHSSNTVVLDQILMFFPLLLIGGWQLSAPSRQPLLVLTAAVYVYLLTARLREAGFLS
mmetsp:Transcript_33256/g.87491  ORF Transcript_33256/g.87491 Transcript_33256/m.87491 type:complete len:300 (-) Transcript_33256:110-1009(-)